MRCVWETVKLAVGDPQRPPVPFAAMEGRRTRSYAGSGSGKGPDSIGGVAKGFGPDRAQFLRVSMSFYDTAYCPIYMERRGESFYSFYAFYGK